MWTSLRAFRYRGVQYKPGDKVPAEVVDDSTVDENNDGEESK